MISRTHGLTKPALRHPVTHVRAVNFSELQSFASREVDATCAELPPELRSLAERIPVHFHHLPSTDILGEEFEPDILGLFVGPPYGANTGDTNDVPSQILLFLGNIWEYAEGDREAFTAEVHITFLHELGHYFGWDEDDLAARDLD